MKKKNSLPARWLEYKNIGERIAGTPFIAFKVPLGENFFSRLGVKDRFTPDELLDANPEMRLIIDLTNTQRYYSAQAIERKGVKYCKLICPGRMVPAERLIIRFCDIVHDFLSSCSVNAEDTVIGVHCTHGVNRTGFMICSFMIRHLMMHPREAIKVFETARGHTIERQEYVEALIRQYSRNVAQRKRRTPPRGIPPMRNSIGGASDGGPQPHQRYGFGIVTFPSSSTTSWTPSPNPPSVSLGSVDHGNSWRPTGSVPQHIRWTDSPEPEAGPSQKAVRSEPPYVPQCVGDGDDGATKNGGGNGGRGGSGGSRKGKKDKRFRKRRRPSPVGPEGEDARDCNDRDPNAGQSNPENVHLQRSPDASPDANKETRYAEKGRRRGEASKKQSNARTGARESSPKIGTSVSGQSQKDCAATATQSATSPSSAFIEISADVEDTSPSPAFVEITANVEATVSDNMVTLFGPTTSVKVFSSSPSTQGMAPMSLTFPSISPPHTPSPFFRGRSPTRSFCSTASRSPLYDSEKAFPSFDSSDDSEASSELYWRYSRRDSTNAKKNLYGYRRVSPPPRCLVIEHVTIESSQENDSSSSWGSWPGSNRATSDASYGRKYDIECVPHYETGSDVEYDPEFAPSLSFESGLSPDLSDLDLDALEDELENLGAGRLGGQRPFGNLVPPTDRPTAPTPPEGPQPPQPEPHPPPPPPPSPPAPPAPQHQVVMHLPPPPQQVLEDLPPRLGFHMNENPHPNQDRERDADRDRDLDWEAILASLHDHTRASAGRASRYAMRSSPAPAPGELGGDTSGDEDEDVMIGLNRRIRRRRRRSVAVPVNRPRNRANASTSRDSPRRPGERGPNMERGPRASPLIHIPLRIGSIRIGGPREPRSHASPPYTDCKRVKASTLRI